MRKFDDLADNFPGTSQKYINRRENDKCRVCTRETYAARSR